MRFSIKIMDYYFVILLFILLSTRIEFILGKINDSRREQRQYSIFESQQQQQQQQQQQEKLCITRKGYPGKCEPFNHCFPFIYRSSFFSTTTTTTHTENEFENINSGLAEEIFNSTQDSTCTSLLSTENENMVCCTLERKLNFDISQKPTVPLNNIINEQCGYIRTQLNNNNNERALGATKITGGRQAQKGEFPWMVAIFGPNGKHTCGGALLNKEYVLTAAHCISTYNGNDVGNLTVTIGDHNIKSTSDGLHEHRKITKILIHSGFRIATHFNDIALLKLNKPVTFTNHIQPICLPNMNLVKIEGNKTVVAGWGRDRSHGYPANILRKVEIPIWSLAECKRIYGIFAPGRVTESNICAGDGKRNKDACIGDSGGPLSINFNSKWYVVGIVSWGKGCGSFPGVYTRVDSFLPWIEKNMK